MAIVVLPCLPRLQTLACRIPIPARLHITSRALRWVTGSTPACLDSCISCWSVSPPHRSPSQP